jgi:DNA-binding PucR family transcriptional regulator
VFYFAAQRRPRIARYVDDALVTAMAKDEVLTASLRQIYLTPLEAGREGGAIDRETLRAYFAAGRNGRAAAAALSVSRQAVSTRLRSVEEKIGRPLLACATDLELALRLADRELI